MYLSSLRNLVQSNKCVLMVKDFGFWLLYRILVHRYWRLYSPNDHLAITYRDFKVVFLCLISIKLGIGGTLANERWISDFQKYQVPPYLQKFIEYLPRNGVFRFLPFLIIEVVLCPNLIDELNEIRKNGDLFFSLDRLRVTFAKNKVYFEDWLNADLKLNFTLCDFLHSSNDSLALQIFDASNKTESQNDVSKLVTLYTTCCYTAMSTSLAVCLVFSLTCKTNDINNSKLFFGSKFCCSLGDNEQHQTLILDAIFKLIGSPKHQVDPRKDERNVSSLQDSRRVPPIKSLQKDTSRTVSDTKLVSIKTDDIVQLFKTFLDNYIIQNKHLDFNKIDSSGRLFNFNSP